MRFSRRPVSRPGAVFLLATTCAALSLACHSPHTFVFHCEQGVDIYAVFVPDSVWLTFPDRAVELPQVVSADGARYSNGTLIFWNKGQDALVREVDSATSRTCHTDQTPL